MRADVSGHWRDGRGSQSVRRRSRRAIACSRAGSGGFDVAARERLLAIAGLAAFLAGTMPGLDRAAIDADASSACSSRCYSRCSTRARQASVSAPPEHRAALGDERSLRLIDLLAAAPVPLALLARRSGRAARLFGVFWSLKLIRMNPAFSLLVRVLRNERQPLMSVTTAFVVVVLFAATAAFLAERDEPARRLRQRAGGALVGGHHDHHDRLRRQDPRLPRRPRCLPAF